MMKWLNDDAAPRGFRAAGVRAGIKTTGPDLALIAAEGGVSAALFTRSQFAAPPVLVSRGHAASGCLSAIVANSGCANCCTGEAGLQDAREMANLVSQAVGIPPEQVLVASTGIIGPPLPMDRIRAGVRDAALALSPEGFGSAVEAIMTTDLRPKLGALSVEIGGTPVIIAGMVKGAGMVAPRMATVFGFFTTDAAIEQPVLDAIFRRVIRRSLNRATVDGDTSTNDTACILASGAAQNETIKSGAVEADLFEEALSEIAIKLARRMAREGEGANHLITIRVLGARVEEDAETIALTIANSPLVKSAIFGRDANWGRIAMAAGRAGVPFDQRQVDIDLNGFRMAVGGMQAKFDDAAVQASLAQDEIFIKVNLNAGPAEATAWACDLSYEYVKINAEYHT